MKPHRMRMTHNLLLNYGLYRKMEVCRPHKATQVPSLHLNRLLKCCGSRIRLFSIPDPKCLHPGSRIQGSKRHSIPDPDPQHWFTCHFFISVLDSHAGKFWPVRHSFCLDLYFNLPFFFIQDEMTKFHSDDYIKFLRSIRPDNMSEYSKLLQRWEKAKRYCSFWLRLKSRYGTYFVTCFYICMVPVPILTKISLIIINFKSLF